MIAPPVCPRCAIPLSPSTDHHHAQCQQCGTRYRLTSHKAAAHAHAGHKGPLTPPPLPGRVVPHAAAPTPPPPAPPVAAPAPAAVVAPAGGIVRVHRHARKPFYRRAGFYVVIGGILTALVGGIALAMSIARLSDSPDTSAADAERELAARYAEQLNAVRQRKPVQDAPLTPPVLPTDTSLEKMTRAIYQGAPGAIPEAALPGSRRIDELVFARLKEKGIAPAAPCSDAVFVRRAYLDIIGRIPTAAEARAFLEDKKPERRQLLIDHLLTQPEFADYWAMKWGDILRIKSEFPINLWPNGVQAYYVWVRAALRENKPFDQFARALLTSSGSNFRTPPANFYRAIQGRDPRSVARTVALTFMGVRPESWPAERWEGMSAFFSQIGYKATGEWKEEIVFFDPSKQRKPSEAIFPDGTKAQIGPDQDPRLVFADWLITPKNPWFTRNIANRAWSWLLGRGVIHEPDDIRDNNPPSNPELLAHLEQELVAAGYDLKLYFRVILNSRTYQLASIPASKHPEAAALFAFYPIRRLEAEVLIDAICQVTGTTEQYSSPIPEPFTYIPEGHRSIRLPDASITSSFLELFGRPSRDTGLESERNNNFTPGQRLHLLNSTHINRKINDGPGLKQLSGSPGEPQKFAEELYLTILSRFPTEDEMDAVSSYSQSGSWGRSPAIDIAWALINSADFLCRH